MNPLDDICAFLSHFAETADIAHDYNVPESQLIKIYYALF